MLWYKQRTVFGQSNQASLMSINSCGQSCCSRFRSRRTVALLTIEIVAVIQMLLPAATSGVVAATSVQHHRVITVSDLWRLNKHNLEGTTTSGVPPRRNEFGRLFNHITSSQRAESEQTSELMAHQQPNDANVYDVIDRVMTGAHKQNTSDMAADLLQQQLQQRLKLQAQSAGIPGSNVGRGRRGHVNRNVADDDSATTTTTKRRSILGLDNLDYTASTLDRARSRQQQQQLLASAAVTVAAAAAAHRQLSSGRGLLDTNGEERKLKLGELLRSGGQKHGLSAAVRPPGGGQLTSLNISHHNLRKMMHIINAGRRRRHSR